MTRRTPARQNTGRRRELRLTHRRADSEVAFDKEYQRLKKTVAFLRATADNARMTAEEAAATRLKYRATREMTAATRQASEYLLKNVQKQLRNLERSTAREKSRGNGQLTKERPSLAFPAAVAHEINNPLEAIATLLYLLEHEAKFSDKGREYLTTIKAEVGRVAEIAQSALEKFRHDETPVQIDLAKCIERVLDVYRAKFEAKRIAVITEHRCQRGIRAHPRQLHEVFSNLFLNAIDAMRRGGKLRIRTSEASNSSGGRDGVRILVADNGHGIPPEHLNRIFEPAFSTKGKRGTGIGLSVVQEIVHDHGGTVRVRSSIQQPNRGTAFSIFLPFGEPPHSAAA